MHRFKTSLALATAFTLVASAFAQKPETPKAAEKGGQGTAGDAYKKHARGKLIQKAVKLSL